MELQHRFTVPASVDETWALFNDLEVVAPCFPGAALTSAEGDDFAGTVKVKLGPVALQYSGTGTFVERDEATHTARIEAKGKDKRGNGTAAAKVKTVLLAEGDGTAVEVSTDLSVTGKPAQFGRGLMQDVSDKLLGKFVTCLTDKLTSEPAPAPADAGGNGAAGAAAGSGGAAASSGEAAADAGPPPGPTPMDVVPAPIPDEELAREPVTGGPTAGARAGSPDASTSASTSAGTAASTVGSTTGSAPARPSQESATSDDDDDGGLDLVSTLLPVLAKRYGPPALGALGLLVGLLIVRRLLRR